MAIKFLNTVAVDTDVLYVDASSNSVGIGTTNPGGKLEVKQDANNGATTAFTSPHIKLTATATADNQGFVGITAATSTSPTASEPDTPIRRPARTWSPACVSTS